MCTKTRYAARSISPVELAISMSNEYFDMVKCGCKACLVSVANCQNDSVLLFKLIRELVRTKPGVCFCAMFEGWTVQELVGRVPF